MALTAIEKPSKVHRFTRQYQMGAPLVALNLLESDSSGVIYLGGTLEDPKSTPEKMVFSVLILCLDSLDGHPLGKVSVAANVDADETLKEFAVAPNGGILMLQRNESGSQLIQLSCQ